MTRITTLVLVALFSVVSVVSTSAAETDLLVPGDKLKASLEDTGTDYAAVAAVIEATMVGSSPTIPDGESTRSWREAAIGLRLMALDKKKGKLFWLGAVMAFNQNGKGYGLRRTVKLLVGNEQLSDAANWRQATSAEVADLQELADVALLNRVRPVTTLPDPE